jgi:tetratricopeptide (TPR) repeat protein
MLMDRYGLGISTSSPESRDAYIEGSDLLLTFYPGAIEAFDQALAADPGFRDARYNLALLESRLENWRAALDSAEDWLAGARPGEDTGPARRLAALCRMQLAAQGRRATE